MLDAGARSTVAIPFDGYAPDDVALYFGTIPIPSTWPAGSGLGRLREGRFESIFGRQVPLFSGVNGIVQTPAGETWLAGPAVSCASARPRWSAPSTNMIE